MHIKNHVKCVLHDIYVRLYSLVHTNLAIVTVRQDGVRDRRLSLAILLECLYQCTDLLATPMLLSRHEISVEDHSGPLGDRVHTTST